MSSLILPGQSGFDVPREVRDVTITWSEEDVPKTLRKDVECNFHLFPLYVEAVKKAVLRSLEHPDTRPRAISESLLRERVKACHDAIVTMREDMKFSLKRCFDILPEKFVEALRRGQRTADVAAHDADQPMWTRPGETHTYHIPTKDADGAKDLTSEAADVPDEELPNGLSQEELARLDPNSR